MPAAKKPRYKVAYRYAIMNKACQINCIKTWPQRSLAVAYRDKTEALRADVIVKVEIHVP